MHHGHHLSSHPPPPPSLGGVSLRHLTGHGVVGWVSFGKAGSTSMRAMLDKRVHHYHWQAHTPKGDAQVCHAKKPNKVTVARRTNIEHVMRPCHRPPCAEVPDGYVVQTDFGFCEALSGFTGRRCRYVTMLREPVSRTVSGWSYFCQSCAEGGIQCVKDKDERRQKALYNGRLQRDPDGVPLEHEPLGSCPNMSLVDYAVHQGNKYTNMFGINASNYASGECVNESPCLSKTRDPRAPCKPGALERAQAALRRDDMLVLLLEDLSRGGAEALWRSLNESTRGIEMLSQKPPDANSHEHKHEPTAKELRALRRVLSTDVQLYNSVAYNSSRPPQEKHHQDHRGHGRRLAPAPVALWNGQLLRWPDGYALPF